MVSYRKTMTLYRDDEEVGKVRVLIDWTEGSRITSKKLPEGSVHDEDSEEDVRKGLEEDLEGSGSVHYSEYHTYELMW